MAFYTTQLHIRKGESKGELETLCVSFGARVSKEASRESLFGAVPRRHIN